MLLKSLNRKLAFDVLTDIETMVGDIGPKSTEALDRFISKYPDLIENERLWAVGADYVD